MANIVYLNGQWLAQNEAMVSVLDQGILRGDGLFETIRGYKGKIPFLKDHLERVFHSAELVGISLPLNKKELASALLEILKRNNLEEGRLRLVVTRGVGQSMDPIEQENASITPTVFILVEPIPKHLSEEFYQKGVSVITTPVSIFNQLFPVSIKSISYFHNMAAKRYARGKGAFEAILTDPTGYCTEGSTSNLFWIRNLQVYTTPLWVGALPGVTRINLLEVFKKTGRTLVEEKIHKKDLPKVDEVYITSSVIGILPVTRVDDIQIGEKVGPITQSIREAFLKHLQEHL